MGVGVTGCRGVRRNDSPTPCTTSAASTHPSPITLKQQRHLAEPAQEASAPDNFVLRYRQPELRVAPDQRLEGDLPLDPGQRRAQANVDPLAESDMSVSVRPADIEGVGIG